jgi:hypothetical protein
MPRGPAPKDPAKRQRRNAPTFATTVIAADARAVDPPELLPGDWHSETLHWWRTWCSSPQASLFLSTDWCALQLVAHHVESYWRSTDGREIVGLLAEIRRWESKFGATVADRARLRWVIEA